MAEKPTNHVTPVFSEQGISSRSPGDIAREAIPLLEKAIFDEFGLKVKMGAELEFCARHASPELSYMHEKDSHVPSGLRRKKKDKVLLFENSPIVSRFYKEKESDPENHITHLEVVFSHTPANRDTSIENDLVYLAESIVRTRTKIQGFEPLYDPEFNPGSSPPLKHTVGDYFKHATFDAFVPRRSSTRPELTADPDASKGLANGLHLNLSLWDKNTNIFNAARFRLGNARFPIEADATLRKALWDVFSENYLTLAPRKNAYLRCAERGVDTDEIEIWEKGPYIENRIPPADANPYTAIMMNLAGVYMGLHRLQTPSQRIGEIDTLEGPKNISQAQKLFENGTHLTSLLNNLQPGLGDEFHAAVMHQTKIRQGQSPAG